MPRPTMVSVVVHNVLAKNRDNLVQKLVAIDRCLTDADTHLNQPAAAPIAGGGRRPPAPVARNHGVNEMRLFLGPEFYFGSAENPSNHRKWLDVTRELTRISQRHPRWVIIPGTGIWDDQFNEFRRNSSMVYYNGQLVHAYCKHHPQGEHANKAWSEHYPGNICSDSVFTISDVVFGIDICNDYRMGALKTYYDNTYAAATGPGKPAWTRQVNTQPGVDIHLLQSNSLRPIDTRAHNHFGGGLVGFNHACAKPNGYIVTCDGSFQPNQLPAVYNRKCTVHKHTRAAMNYTNFPHPVRPADVNAYRNARYWLVPSGSLIANNSMMCFDRLTLS